MRDSGVDRTLNQGSLSFKPEDRVKATLQFAETIREFRGKNPVRLRTGTSVMRNDLGPPLELSPLLRALAGHRVDFVVVGGVAGGFHGSSYPTYDLDIAYERGDTNLERVARALTDLRVRLRGALPDLPFQPDPQTLANGANFTFETPFGRFDVLGDIAGVRDYATLKRDARIESYEGLDVRVASIDHLVAMKRAANRTKDKLMLEEYLVIAEEERKLS